jgi:4-amino-4-deoxy-L-arabinose transferase-like glycosyltransferase
MPHLPGRARDVKRAHVLFLALLCAAMFAPGIATLPPVDRDEARYAQATRQMLASRDFIDIRFQDAPRHNKPAGIYWLQAAAATLVGRANDPPMWVIRVPSLTAATLAVLSTGALGTALFSPVVGLLAALFLAASVLLNVEARMGTTDAALLASIVAAQGILARAYVGRSIARGSRLLFWAAVGIAFLLKGPVVLLVCAGTIAFLFLLDRKLEWVSAIASWDGVAVLLTIILPWFFAIGHFIGGSYFATWLAQDVLGKVTTGQEGHGAPPGYHLVVFAVAFWPFSLFAWCAAPWVWRQRRQPNVRFCLAWVVPTWMAFELAATKLPHYTLPVYPAIALLAAAALTHGAIADFVFTRTRLAAALGWTWIVVGGLVAAALVGAPYWVDGELTGTALGASAVVLTGSGAAAVFLCRQQLERAVVILVTAVLLVYGLVFARLLPETESLWVSQRAASLVQTVRPCPESIVAAVDYNEPSLVVLLGTNTRLVDLNGAVEHLTANASCGLALVPERDATGFETVLVRRGVSATRIGEVHGLNYVTGRRVALALYGARAAAETTYRP